MKSSRISARRRDSRFDPTLSRGIIAVMLAIAAAIITLSFFDKAGTLGVIINEWLLSALFGAMRYATPAVLLILAWFIHKERGYQYRATHGLGALLFFLATASLFHLSFDPTDMWREALEGHGGGVFGLPAWVLKSYLGTIGSLVILIGLTIVSVLLIFNTSIIEFILLHKKLFVKLGVIGKSLIQAVQTLFVLPNSNGRLRVSGDYEKTPFEDGEPLPEEETAPKRFFAKQIKQTNGEGEKEYEIPDKEHETNIDPKTVISAPAWMQRVIVKNLPPLTLLSNKRTKPTSGDIQANAEIIKKTLLEFGIEVDMGGVRVGPTVTQYTLKPAGGIKLARLTALSNDLALALAAHPIRIEAPIPGKSLVGLEVPNQRVALVMLKELLESDEFKKRPHNLMMALGKDVAGKVWFADLPRMPHLLIAGATGSGKTMCINTIIMSLLYQNTAETLRLIMVDPKRVELTMFEGLPHLLTPVVTNTHKTINALNWTIGEMERRFEILSQSGSRDIHSYNQKYKESQLPHIVFIIDELADLMAAAVSEVEARIIRLAQMARATGIHLILATQRPSVDVITGLMKANIPARIAFSVASLIDSRTILDTPGAEKLLGRGDMLFLTAELSKPVRIQGAYVSEEELKNVVDYLRSDGMLQYDESIVEKPGGESGGTLNLFGGPSDDQDLLFNEAKEAILRAGKASASFLQRRFKIGYARAARILDELEEAGIIGPGEGAKPREILVTGSEIGDTMDSGRELNVFNEGDKEPMMKKDHGNVTM